jgi:hypothetical protein
MMMAASMNRKEVPESREVQEQSIIDVMTNKAGGAVIIDPDGNEMTLDDHLKEMGKTKEEWDAMIREGIKLFFDQGGHIHGDCDCPPETWEAAQVEWMQGDAAAGFQRGGKTGSSYESVFGVPLFPEDDGGTDD